MKITAPPIDTGIVDRSDRQPAASVMQALLFTEILKPLATALGPVGETVLGSVAQTTFVRNRP
jgi:hypothetical protein